MARAPRWEQESDDALVEFGRCDPDPANRRAAVEALVERWSDRVIAWAQRFARDREVALDVAQDSLVAMLQALPRYEPGGRFGAWLFVIVQNRCRNVARVRGLRRDPEVDLDELAAAEATPEEAFESRDALRRLLVAMEHALEPRERTALWLRAAEGMSVEDITQVLGIDGASGARALLQGARRKLRAELVRHPRPHEEKP